MKTGREGPGTHSAQQASPGLTWPLCLGTWLSSAVWAPVEESPGPPSPRCVLEGGGARWGCGGGAVTLSVLSPAPCCLQGVKLLSYLYQEALDNCSNEHYPVLLSLLQTSCEPYTRWGRALGGLSRGRGCTQS